MEHSALIRHSGGPATEGGISDSAGHLRPKNGLPSFSGSARTQAQDHSPHLTHAKMSRRSSHRREAAEQYLIRMTAAHDSHHAKNDRDTGILIAIPAAHPQITHARATSCIRSTG